jgi:hypothetical protein
MGWVAKEIKRKKPKEEHKMGNLSSCTSDVKDGRKVSASMRKKGNGVDAFGNVTRKGKGWLSCRVCRVFPFC